MLILSGRVLSGCDWAVEKAYDEEHGAYQITASD